MLTLSNADGSVRLEGRSGVTVSERLRRAQISPKYSPPTSKIRNKSTTCPKIIRIISKISSNTGLSAHIKIEP